MIIIPALLVANLFSLIPAMKFIIPSGMILIITAGISSEIKFPIVNPGKALHTSFFFQLKYLFSQILLQTGAKIPVAGLDYTYRSSFGTFLSGRLPCGQRACPSRISYRLAVYLPLSFESSGILYHACQVGLILIKMLVDKIVDYYLYSYCIKRQICSK